MNGNGRKDVQITKDEDGVVGIVITIKSGSGEAGLAAYITAGLFFATLLIFMFSDGKVSWDGFLITLAILIGSLAIAGV